MFEIYEDIDGEWRWRLVADNGEIVAQSEGYSRKEDAERGAAAVKRLAPAAELRFEDAATAGGADA